MELTTATITFASPGITNPPASETVAGVMRRATTAQATGGTNDTAAMTSAKTKAQINDRFGGGAPSTFVKTLLGLATDAAIRLGLGIKSAGLKDEGAGGGLDADTLDGQHGAYYLNYSNLSNRPAAAIPVTEKGAALGVATLNFIGQIPTSQLPLLALADVFVVASQAAQLALTAQEGDVVRIELALRRLQ